MDRLIVCRWVGGGAGKWGDRKVYQFLMIFTLPRGKQNPRGTIAFKIAILISAAWPSSLEWSPQYPDTKPQEGEVPASAGSRTGKLFILGASLGSESCFDWKVGHSFLADLCCQQKLACYPIPPIFLSSRPHPSLVWAAFILLKPSFHNSHCAMLTLRVREKGQWRV